MRCRCREALLLGRRGRAHLGQIQGAAQALTVLASALGPLLLAWCVEWSGSYQAVFQALASAIAALGAAALLFEPSRRRRRGQVVNHERGG